MNAPQFTPGPWSIVPYGDERNTNLVIHSSPQNRVCFMATPGQGLDDASHIEANARLLAAAPELFDALIVARGEVAQHHNSRSALPQINSALAKAVGGQ